MSYGASSHERDSGLGDAAPRRTVGPYQLVSQLGTGPHGPSFVARLPGNDTSFALKLCRPDLNAEEVARIRQDVQTVTRLDHPGIVRPIDVGMDRRALYVVSEHGEGRSLQEQLNRAGPVEPAEAARLVARVAEALQVAHEAGLLHRDLRPSSVTLDPRDGRPRLTDLGLGPVAREAHPTYRPPEVLEGKPHDVRGDVYGLGAILYELLTGAPPFEGHSPHEVREAILSGRLTRPRELVPDVDPRIERVCLRALARDPRRRPRSALALARDLRRAAGGARGMSQATLLALGATWLMTLTLPAAWALRERRERDALGQALGTQLTASQAEVTSRTAERDQARRELDEQRQAVQRATREREDAQRRLQQVEGQASQFQQRVRQQIEALQGALKAKQDEPPEALRAALGLLQRLRRAEDPAALEAWVLVHLTHHEEAEQLLERLLAARPDDPELLMVRVRLLRQAGRQQECLALLRRLAELPQECPPRFTARFVLAPPAPQSLEEVQALVEQTVALAQGRAYALVQVARLVFQLATRLRNVALLGRAIELTELALRDAPLDHEILGLRSDALWQWAELQQDPQQAQRLRAGAQSDLRLARQLVPLPTYWLTGGQRQLQLGQPHQALDELQQALELAERNPQHVQPRIMARVQFGNALAELQQQAPAVKLWCGAIELAAAEGVQGAVQLLPLLAAIADGATSLTDQRQLDQLVEQMNRLPPEAGQRLVQHLKATLEARRGQQRP